MSQKWITIYDAAERMIELGKYMRSETLQRYCREGIIASRVGDHGGYEVPATIVYTLPGIQPKHAPNVDRYTPRTCPTCGVTEGDTYTADQAARTGKDVAGLHAVFFPRNRRGYAKEHECKACKLKMMPRELSAEKEAQRCPPGYGELSEVMDMIGVSRQRIDHYVQSGRLKRVPQPDKRRRYFYDLDDAKDIALDLSRLKYSGHKEAE